ncbi:hypothetical protein A9264_14485 [Vibrio sp. UCD-FRSSP16_10]|uniref:DUF2947 domain-containing protein n=1 Tax=unclassified Vibrio TaxID=2614977 RepID=UPI000800AC2E|nr:MULTISPECIES: DUF2947 domain-containing protein [unclassified Vibrio]OBT13171.1 hypothetical protein A9260_14865 [Vibrio sp. UCD-FRSSP16_30]OBT19572.1 hypothetical protein A9264_14485 [Vibrio sp. UCD-FRSSP16_10]
MDYISLDDYSRKWIFTHQSMPIPEQDLAAIQPMSQAKSAQFWKDNVSKQSPDAERMSSQDWPTTDANWPNSVNWMSRWESDNEELPTEITEHIDWQDDVTIYFCYEKYNVVQTTWATFKKHWKNFLFFDDGPILLGRRRKQALWFNTDGQVKLGNRP